MKLQTSSPSTKRTIKRLQTLVKASELLTSSLDLDRVLQTLLTLTTKHLKASTGSIYLIDKAKRELWARTMKAKKRMEIRLPMGQGIAGHVAKTGRTVRIRDVYNDKRFYRGIDLKTGFRTRTMLCMPMKDAGGRTVGVFQILNKRIGVFTKDDERFLKAVSIPATIAIENARLHLAEIEGQKMARELELAAAIQQQILPKSIPHINGVQISAMTRPCRAVGGDFYDLVPLEEDKVALAIADVSGKGISGALLVSTFQAALHAYLEFALPLTEIASRLNSIIYEDSTSESFITCVLCVYEARTRKLRYVNAGHNYPIVFKPTGGFVQLEAGGIGLGMIPDVRYTEGEIQLNGSELLLLYTDGVTEAMNRTQDLYGETRLCTQISNLLSCGPGEIETHIVNDVESFSEGIPQVDDCTMVLMKVT